MEIEQSTAESVWFSEDGRLGGVLHYPAHGAARLAVLLCSPHPNFAGDMENNVILTLANHLGVEYVTFRFDYRGIGQSRIDLPAGMSVFDYWDHVEQTHDYATAIADTKCAADELWQLSAHLPMVAIGYSFGAMTATQLAVSDGRIIAMAGIAPPLQRLSFDHLADCPKPCLMLSGEDDFVFDPKVAANLIARSGPSLVFERIDGADHFFRDQELVLAERVKRFVRQCLEDLLDEAPRPAHSSH